MDIKIVKSITGNISDRIPTRYDDITKEIMQDKMTAMLKEYEKYVSSPADKEVIYYKLGDVLGETLNKLG